MTSSQLKSAFGMLGVIVGVVESKLALLSVLLPPKVAAWLPVVVAIGGGIVTLYNQSLNSSHVSIPVEQAKELGIDPSLHGGKS